MKLILRERKFLKEENNSQKSLSFRVKIDPQLFLNLTPNDEAAQIKLRATHAVGQFSQEKAGDMFLTVQPSSGKVIEHSGRARSQAAVNAGTEKVAITIRLPEGHPPVSWQSLPAVFVQQDTEENPGTNRVEKSELIPLATEQTSDADPLHIGSEKTFRDEVMPAAILPSGYRRPEMVTKQAEQIAKVFIKDAYAKYAESVKRNLGAISLDDAIAKSGLGHNEYVEKNITDFQNMFDSQYSISDESGELRFNYMDERYKGRPWNRQPIGAISIKRK
jgi:hypothetical protein